MIHDTWHRVLASKIYNNIALQDFLYLNRFENIQTLRSIIFDMEINNYDL